MRVYVRLLVCTRARACACVCARVHVCVLARARACVDACVRVRACACERVRARVRACVRACVCECARARARACVRACVLCLVCATPRHELPSPARLPVTQAPKTHAERHAAKATTKPPIPTLPMLRRRPWFGSLTHVVQLQLSHRGLDANAWGHAIELTFLQIVFLRSRWSRPTSSGFFHRT